MNMRVLYVPITGDRKIMDRYVTKDEYASTLRESDESERDKATH